MFSHVARNLYTPVIMLRNLRAAHSTHSRRLLKWFLVKFTDAMNKFSTESNLISTCVFHLILFHYDVYIVFVCFRGPFFLGTSNLLLLVFISINPPFLENQFGPRITSEQSRTAGMDRMNTPRRVDWPVLVGGEKGHFVLDYPWIIGRLSPLVFPDALENCSAEKCLSGVPPTSRWRWFGPKIWFRRARMAVSPINQSIHRCIRCWSESPHVIQGFRFWSLIYWWNILSLLGKFFRYGFVELRSGNTWSMEFRLTNYDFAVHRGINQSSKQAISRSIEWALCAVVYSFAVFLMLFVLTFTFLAETNNAYITIQLGKEKFETSVLEKTKAPEWNEECELYVCNV